jgi:hypothetical protein
MTDETLIAVISAGAAIISALVSWRSFSVSREALRIAKIDHRERHEELKLYLIDGISWDARSGDTYVLFALSFTNSANAPDSLVRIEIKIYAYDSDGNLSHVILEPTPTVVTEIVPWQLEPFRSPINFPPRHTVSGWIGFKLPTLFSKSRTIDRYELIGITATGNKVSVECYLLRKVTDER